MTYVKPRVTSYTSDTHGKSLMLSPGGADFDVNIQPYYTINDKRVLSPRKSGCDADKFITHNSSHMTHNCATTNNKNINQSREAPVHDRGGPVEPARGHLSG